MRSLVANLTAWRDIFRQREDDCLLGILASAVVGLDLIILWSIT